MPDLGGAIEALAVGALVAFGVAFGALAALALTAFGGWSPSLLTLPVAGGILGSLAARRMLR